MVEYVFEKKRLNILFFNACGFKEVSYLLLNNMNGLSTDCNIFSTAIVNGMLAAELFLKHIKAYDDAVNNNLNTCFLKTHDIDLLFNDLSKKDR